jgi:translation initiation factor 1
MPRDRRLVWSTNDGDLRKAPARPGAQRHGNPSRIRVRREVAGRRGKAVTTVSDVPLDDAGLRELAGKLKKRCGVGGSAKNGVIELQGDHRDAVVAMLREDGYDVVLAGG